MIKSTQKENNNKEPRGRVPYTVTVSNLPQSEIKIEGEIEWQFVSKFRDQARKKLSGDLEIDGFRKGKIPADVAEKHLGAMRILGTAAEHALQEIYPKILRAEKLDTIGRSQVSITKLAEGNPVGFSVSATRVPDVKLGDYRKIAEDARSKKSEPEEVTAEEIADSKKRLQEEWARHDIFEKQKKESDKDAKESSLADISIEDKDLPEFNDEFVRKLGPFKDVADFEKKLKENLKEEKARRSKEKHRVEILSALLQKAEIDIPKLLVESELDTMVGQFKADVSRAGMDFDEYLKNADKTEEQIRKEWHPDAEKRAKTQLILNHIAARENIAPRREDIEEHEKRILAEHKDANPMNVRMYLFTVLTNEAVLNFLETGEKESKRESSTEDTNSDTLEETASEKKDN